MKFEYNLVNRGPRNLNLGMVTIPKGGKKTVQLTLTVDLLSTLNAQGVDVSYTGADGKTYCNAQIFKHETPANVAVLKAAGKYRPLAAQEIAAKVVKVEDMFKPKPATLGDGTVVEECIEPPLPTENDLIAVINAISAIAEAEESKDTAEKTESTVEVILDKMPKQERPHCESPEVVIGEPISVVVSGQTATLDQETAAESQDEEIVIPSREELEEMHGNSVKKLARKLGLDDSGNKAKVIEVILASTDKAAEKEGV